MKVNCVERTYRRGYTKTTEFLEMKLNDGWVVKTVTPFYNDNGGTEFIEYILEKEEE